MFPAFWFKTLLPDGRISGQITQKRPQKMVHGRKKIGGRKIIICGKKWQKRGRKIFFTVILL
jgi:hypothetical protein